MPYLCLCFLLSVHSPHSRSVGTAETPVDTFLRCLLMHLVYTQSNNITILKIVRMITGSMNIFHSHTLCMSLPTPCTYHFQHPVHITSNTLYISLPTPCTYHFQHPVQPGQDEFSSGNTTTAALIIANLIIIIAILVIRH